MTTCNYCYYYYIGTAIVLFLFHSPSDTWRARSYVRTYVYWPTLNVRECMKWERRRRRRRKRYEHYSNTYGLHGGTLYITKPCISLHAYTCQQLRSIPASIKFRFRTAAAAAVAATTSVLPIWYCQSRSLLDRHHFVHITFCYGYIAI